MPIHASNSSRSKTRLGQAIIPLLAIAAFAIVAVALQRAKLGVVEGQPTIQPGNVPAISMMTANIRVAFPTDKDEIWPNRREFLVHTILKYQPDIIGFQEVTPAQGAYLVANLKGYTRVAIESKENAVAGMLDIGVAAASLNQTFYKTDRFNLISSDRGTLRPDLPSSDVYENACYTLAVLADQQKSLPDLVTINTHLGHTVDGTTRSCRQIQNILQQQLQAKPALQAVVLGDMNHDRAGPSYAALIGTEYLPTHPQWVLTDTFRYSDKRPDERWGTYHNFTGRPVATWPTDLIFATSGLHTTPAVIVRDQDTQTGRWPSDHFFVLTTITANH